MATMESQNLHSSIPLSQNSDIASNLKLDVDQNQQQISNLNKTQQAPSKEIIKNKLNMNSSLNAKADTNTSLNDQKKKDQSDLFDDEDILYNDDDENEIFREYNILHDKKLKAMDDIKNINERIKNNKVKIEECKKKLAELKEEKKKRQGDIMNLLSNKESIEEIYKNQIYSLTNTNYNNNTGANGNNNYNENTASLANDINNLNNLMNDNSAIHLNSNHNLTIDNEISNTDEDNFKIAFKEIKESEQPKYVEQVINMFEDIFKKKDENINESISDIINNSYELFINNDNNNNTLDNDVNNNEISVTNFFSKMSLFIANQSLGKFSEIKINLLLRYLLKINYINTKLTRDIKFVNKKYKEQKKELNDLISSLEKKNINLQEKNNRLENNIKEYDDNKLFFGKNDNEELSHEVVIEYEDGIDKNAEINYEDDVIDDNTIEKENEMMNKGLNPYNTNNSNNKNNNNIVKSNPVYKIIGNQNNKQTKRIILKDNDESEDKYLNEFIKNKDNTRNKYILKNKPEIKNNMNPNNKINNNINNNNNENSIRKIKYSNNNQNNIINIDKNKRLCPTPQHHIRKTEEELQNLTTIEKDHYNRVQRIMNSGPKYGIFGVNKYNPETSLNKDTNLFSPKKNITNVPRSSNKIDKTVRIESRQNHNFIGIINMTKVAPIKKKKRESGKKIKDKEDENDGGIKIINLEQDFINEEDKENEEDKKINTSNNVNNNINNNNTSKDIKNTTHQYKNEVQGYYLNIINNVKKAKNENNNTNNNTTNLNNNEKKENPQQSHTYRLNNKRSYKSTRIQGLNLNNDLNKDNNAPKNYLINKMKEAKNELSLNTNITNPTYNSSTNNDSSKRSHSLSEHQSEEENGKKDSNRNKYKTKKIIVMNSVNNEVSPNQTLRKRITSIPVSKAIGLGNKNFSASTYEKVNYKAGNKLNVLNKNKK